MVIDTELTIYNNGWIPLKNQFIILNLKVKIYI